MQAHRIAYKAFSTTPLDGEGSYLYGGRWSSPGTRVAYLSSTHALSQLETLGGLFERGDFDPDNPPALVAVTTEIPAAVSTTGLLKIPRDWRSDAPTGTKKIGDAFISEGVACCLTLPSVYAPGSTTEFNVLINPAHPDFAKITISKKPFAFDPRLLRPPT